MFARDFMDSQIPLRLVPRLYRRANVNLMALKGI